MSRILIAGCGDIGSSLGARLDADGHEVWGLRRSAGEAPAGVRALRADLTRPEQLDRLPAAIDAVVYMATADTFDDRAYESAYVSGVRNLIEALKRSSQAVRRLVYVSSTSVYAQSDGEWVDEDSPTEPARFSGRRLLEAEHLVLDAPIPALVVRFAGIYGRGRNRLLQRVRDGAACQDVPPLYTNRIHRDDCVGVLRHLLAIHEPDRLYVGVDSEPAAQCTVMDWLAAQMQVPPPPRKNAMQDREGQRQSNKRCRNTRLVSSGYRFLYPSYRHGYAAVLAGMSRAQ